MTASNEIVCALYEHVLKREPKAEELSYWVEKCADLAAVPSVIRAFFEGPEYKNQLLAAPGHPPGHFYSPVHDPSLVDRQKIDDDRRNTKTISGINLRVSAQQKLWAEFIEIPLKLTADKSLDRRYYFDNPVYSAGDAAILSCMLAKYRPRLVIEIGSGFSSACMLDAANDYGLSTHFTFIEPYPNALLVHLSDEDRNACKIIVSSVQSVEISLFDELGPGDILFIDSTHIMKTGSDVNFELFEILPRLKAGVIVHFHDIFWPFEYPADWLINRRYSWNELYGLRAFLMNNPRYQILFFNDAFSVLCAEDVKSTSATISGLFAKNPGGGLWLEVLA